MRHTVLLLGLALGLAGCGAQDWWLGARGGVLFQGLDDVTTPGAPAELAASLRGGTLVQGLSDYTVLFYRDNQRIGAAKTDAEGIARIEQTFAEPGLYAVTATLDPAELGSADVPTSTLTVAVFAPDASLAVVDLDETVVGEGFDQVLLADPTPMPYSRPVLRELARRHQILYLTHRPDILVRRSRLWLQTKGFPPGPLIGSTRAGLLEGSGAFKSAVIERLQEHFAVEIGIGDKISDAQAYHEHGLQTFLVIQPGPLPPWELRELAERLEALPPEVQVVTDWREILAALDTGARFDRPDVQQRLGRLADAREAQLHAQTQPARSVQEIQP